MSARPCYRVNLGFPLSTNVMNHKVKCEPGGRMTPKPLVLFTIFPKVCLKSVQIVFHNRFRDYRCSEIYFKLTWTLPSNCFWIASFPSIMRRHPSTKISCQDLLLNYHRPDRYHRHALEWIAGILCQSTSISNSLSNISKCGKALSAVNNLQYQHLKCHCSGPQESLWVPGEMCSGIPRIP